MPRSGWLAVGAVVAALGTTQPWIGRAWLEQPATWLLLGGSWLAALARHPTPEPPGEPGRRRLPLVSLIALTAGALLIGLRLSALPLAAAATTVDLPTGTGPWRASVDAIGNPRDGRQVATVAIGGGAHEPLTVAITAPPDPALTVGDLVILTGRLQLVPDGPYGAWLGQAGV